MADITITIPTDKVPLVKAMILDRTNQPDLTNPELVAWLESYLISTVRGLVHDYQLREFANTFIFDNPII